MKLKMKRTLSCLLTVLLLLTMLPVSALAAEGLKDELGITNEDITVTEITKDNEAILSQAASDRRWGVYAAGMNFTFGYIHSACHIASSEDTAPEYVTITMDKPAQTEAEGKNFTTGWAVLALVDGKLVTYPTEEVENNKLKFTVRLGEDGTDLALSHLSDLSTTQLVHAVGDWGTLTLTPGDVEYNDSLGYVRSYNLTLSISDNIVKSLKNEDFEYNFSLAFYLNSIGLKIDTDSISFEENDLFKLDPEQTEKVSDGCYMFTADVDIDAWKTGEITEVVGISYAAPNTETLLFEGEMQASLPSTSSWAGMIGCVPLALTVVQPESTDIYHKITVTQREGGEISPRGVENEVWVKEGEPQTFTITPDQGYHIADVIVDNESVGAVETYTFESVADDSHSITAVFEKNPYVTITPADMTIYMGGDGGYDAVVGDNGEIVTSTNSLPHPLFTVTMPDDSSATPTDLTFTNGETGEAEKTWTLVCDNPTSAGQKYYHFLEGDSQDKVRVTYTDAKGNEHISDEFNPSEVKDVFTTYTIAIYPGENNLSTITAKDTAGKDYNITAETGTLTVRAVADNDPTSDIADAAPTELVDSGKAVAVAPEGTAYTLNNTGVQLPDDAKPSLLFDSIIEDTADSTARTNALKARITSEYGADTNVYEIKYLDLVDANNGNAWIKASKPVDIYWGYPEGTDQSTQFAVVHFKDLHRDGENSGYETSDIENCEVETIQTQNTEYGIKFTVQPGQFSPFALVKAQVFTIEASAGENGSISPSGSVAVVKDTDQTFTITPNSGYHIADVKVDGVSVGAVDTYTFHDVTANHTISATFDRSSSGGGTGTRDDYTLHYVTNGGNHLSSETKSSAWTKDYEDLPIPVRDGYTFEGWYWDLRLTEPVTGDVKVDKTTVTLYAKWSGSSYDPDDTGVSKWLETDEHNAFLSGYPDGSFQADKNMTRAEVAQMFYALLLDKNVTITKTFSDVEDDAWYATAVNTMASLGMLEGYPDGTFRPDAPITRAEFAAIALAFAYDPASASCSYTDVSTSAWYYTYVAQATTYGWIGGYPDGSFRPNNSITRAEVAVIVNNMLGRSADKSYIDRNADELVSFVDLSKTHWAYYTIMEATNSHDYTTSSNGESWKA